MSVRAAAAQLSAPVGLAATSSGSTVRLSWSAPSSTSPITSYIVEAGSRPGAADLANFPTGSAAVSFTAAGVGAGSYYVRVRAVSAEGTSAPSNEVVLTVTAVGCTGAPGAPSGLVVLSISGGTISLMWNGASGSPTSYVVEAGSAPGLSNLANSDLGGTSTGMTASNLGPGVYYIRVRAKNACGIGPASNEVEAIVSSSRRPFSGTWSGPSGVSFRIVPASSEEEAFDSFTFSFRFEGCDIEGTVTDSFGNYKTNGLPGPLIRNETVSGGAFEGGPLSVSLSQGRVAQVRYVVDSVQFDSTTTALGSIWISVSDSRLCGASATRRWTANKTGQ